MITSRRRSGGELVFGLVADVPGRGSCPLVGPTGYGDRLPDGPRSGRLDSSEFVPDGSHGRWSGRLCPSDERGHDRPRDIDVGGEQAAAEDDRGERPCCRARPRRATI